MAERILVIKLGALGDMVQATGPFASIRAHHPDAHVTLLTTMTYADFARAMPWFDAVAVDERPKPWQPRKVWALRRWLRQGRFDRVYDLQTSSRSSRYFALAGRPPWSGIAGGCSMPHANPDRDFMHTVDRQAEQLRMAGVDTIHAPDLSFADTDLSGLGLPERFALLVPGGAPHRPAKRWPAEHFCVLARKLWERGITPVTLGTRAEAEAIATIAAACPDTLDLSSRTDLLQIATLGRRALAAVGNDTGPMHILAAAGCPSVVLFSAESDPARCAPRGPWVAVLREPDLRSLTVDAVARALPAACGA